MPENTVVEHGLMGRVAYARIAPNEDLVKGVEKVCLAEGFRNAFVRGALGSLVDASLTFKSDGSKVLVKGPAVEVVSIAGEVRTDEDNTIAATLSGVVADTDGTVYGGSFVPGGNTICMTFEVTLEEWLPANPADQAREASKSEYTQ